jgi:hypothetical protein
MVKIGELNPSELALTPRGHEIVVVSQRDRITVVEVLKTGKKLDIPNTQMVKRASSN